MAFRSRKAGFGDTAQYHDLKAKLSETSKAYGKSYDMCREKYYQKLAKQFCNTTDVSKLVSTLKSLRGIPRSKIPQIVGPGGSLPQSKEESLNNLNIGYCGVGNSSRSNEYNDFYYDGRQAGLKTLRLLKHQVGGKNWRDEVSDLAISKGEILHILEKLKDTACGPDEVCALFLRKTARWSACLLERILNRSLIGGAFPKEWLYSHVVPLLKEGKRDYTTFTSYRPISLTPIMARVCERVIVDRLSQEANKLGILPDCQFGARKGRGTVDALAHAHMGLLAVVQKYDECNAVFLDISKAFDRVDHLLLIHKMQNLGFSEILVWWIFSFLAGRQQRVVVGGDKSTWNAIKTGVPQGTCLGPLLFLIFISDCPVTSRQSFSLAGEATFVDDILIWSEGTSKEQVADLEKRLSAILEWANSWGVDFSIPKTRHVTFGKSGNPTFVKMGGIKLPKVSEYCYLGVWFHSSLTFDCHLEKKILPQVRRQVGFAKHLLSKCKSSARCSFTRILWMAKIRPIIEYASGIWIGSVSSNLIKEIDSIQGEFLRSGMGVPTFSSHEGIRVELAIIKPSIRIQAERIKLYYRFEHKLCPKIVLECRRKLQSITSCQKITKSFYGKTKENAISERHFWVKRNQIRIPLSDNQTFDKYLIDLSTRTPQSKYGFKWLYPTTANRGGWKALVYIVADRKHEGVHCDQTIKQQIAFILSKQKKKRSPKNFVPNSKQKKCNPLRQAIRQWIINEQIKCYLGPKGSKKLSRIRGAVWYHDKLVHETSDPWMRQLRKIRLGVSELLDQTYFFDKTSRVCTSCSAGQIETIDHFLLHCQAYSSIRTPFLQEVKNLGVDATDFKILLGFDPKLKSKSYQKRTFNTRKNILQKTLRFLSDSGRFGKL